MHRIRLRGPWDLVPLDRTDGDAPLPPAGRVDVPGDLSEVVGADFRGRVRLGRRFNSPTNLDPDEQVALVFEALDAQAQLVLNGTPLQFAGQSPARFDIRPLLALHNLLEVTLTLPALPLGEVRLEISSS
jgi:hypothetical protein